MKSLFIPVFCGYNFSHRKDKNFFMSLDETKEYYHPAVLISAGHNYKKKNMIQPTNVDLDKHILLGDSGGFQIASGILTYSDQLRADIFNWLENNSNYAINLDIPPYAYKNSSHSISFEDSLKISKGNFKYFADHQSGKTKFLNVIHGSNYDEMNYWYNNVKEFDFTGGWSIGSIVRSYDALYRILNVMSVLLQNNEFEKFNDKSIIHILGFSKIKEIIFVEYFIKRATQKFNFKGTVSFDSSVTNMMANNLIYCLSYSIFGGRKEFKITHEFDESVICRCEVCRQNLITQNMEFENGRYKAMKEYVFLSLHNLFQITGGFKFINNLVHTLDKENLKQLLNQDEGKILDCIDHIIEDRTTAQTTLQKYQKHFKTSENEQEIVSINDLF